MTFPKISIELSIFEDSYPALETERAQVPDALFGWFRDALAQIDLDVLPDQTPMDFSQTSPPLIELLLCSGETMDMLTNEPCERVSIVETPNGDPLTRHDGIAGNSGRFDVDMRCDIW